MNRIGTPLVVLASIVAAGSARAAVLGSADYGFSVKNEAAISGASDAVYKAVVDDIGKWWSPEHTFSGDARNLSIDAKPGGCFCESLPNGGGVRHLEVVYVAPGKTLRLAGALGPLQGSGLAGSLTLDFEAAGDSTRVVMTYGAGGFYQGGLQAIAPAVDSVLGDQLLRLKRFVETGTP